MSARLAAASTWFDLKAGTQDIDVSTGSLTAVFRPAYL